MIMSHYQRTLKGKIKKNYKNGCYIVMLSVNIRCLHTNRAVTKLKITYHFHKYD